MNKWALLKPLRTVDRGCAKLLRHASIPTPLLCQSAASEAQEHLGENTSSIFKKMNIVILSQYTLETIVYCVAVNELSFVTLAAFDI